MMRSRNYSLIILDEAHRTGAKVWYTGVQRLLAAYPGAQLLGLTATPIRYLDGQRDMAEELFDSCIADSMTLGEAIGRGILPAPKYVISLYAYTDLLNRYEKHAHQASVNIRKRAEEYLERLRRAIAQAEGLDKVFEKHLHRGKYIAFCANANHLQEMVGRVPEWFSGVDSAPHIYSVWTGSDTALKDYAAFKEDCSDHLRLMFCIDMFNEGIHVEDIDGVILFRPTVSPIVYKQQIGRALSAMNEGAPLIIDVVNNYDNLYSFSSLQRELSEFVSFYRNNRRDEAIVNESFEIIDEVRECRQLFEALEEALVPSWEEMYRQACQYFKANGDLRVPKRYRTADGIPLGDWIARQRGARKGTNDQLISDIRVKLLDKIGMVWDDPREIKRNVGLEHAVQYWKKYGTLDIPMSYVCEDGFGLGRWLGTARATYKRKLSAGLDPLTTPHIRALDEMGYKWELVDTFFDDGLAHAKNYYQMYGTLDIAKSVVMEDGYQLGKWISAMRQRYKQTGHNAPLTAAQIEQLEAVGMVWQSASIRNWEHCYEEAAKYYHEHGDLNVPSDYVQNGVKLWRFLNSQKRMYRKGELDEEKVARLEAVGMTWSSRNKGWDEVFKQARAYYNEHGDLEVPPNFITRNGIWLGKWVSTKRLEFQRGALPDAERLALDSLGMRWERTNARRNNPRSRMSRQMPMNATV